MLTRFYKIVSDNTEKVYVGSTRLSLQARLVWHEHDYSMYLHTNIRNITSIEILKCGNYSIQLLEEKLCGDVERDQIESKYIQNTPNIVNKLKRLGEYKRLGATGYAKEYSYEKNNTRMKQHYKENKTNILERSKEKFTCDICGGSYDYSHKSTHMKSKKHLMVIV